MSVRSDFYTAYSAIRKIYRYYDYVRKPGKSRIVGQTITVLDSLPPKVVTEAFKAITNRGYSK